MRCEGIGHCGIQLNMPAKRPRKELKIPPLRRMSGEEIRNWRLKHDLSQQELAELLGIDQTTVSAWEKEKRVPPKYLPLLLMFLEKEGYLS